MHTPVPLCQCTAAIRLRRSTRVPLPVALHVKLRVLIQARRQYLAPRVGRHPRSIVMLPVPLAAMRKLLMRHRLKAQR